MPSDLSNLAGRTQVPSSLLGLRGSTSRRREARWTCLVSGTRASLLASPPRFPEASHSSIVSIHGGTSDPLAWFTKPSRPGVALPTSLASSPALPATSLPTQPQQCPTAPSFPGKLLSILQNPAQCSLLRKGFQTPRGQNDPVFPSSALERTLT